MLRAAGVITDEELLTFRARGSRLEGHPMPRLPWVNVATGSLGLGLPVGVGLALTGRFLDRLPYRAWVLCGDGELAEGSMWEAFEHASCTRLDNLTAIVDVNRLGQRGPARHGWDTAAYARRLAAFGWHTIEIDGHSVTEIDQACTEAAAEAGRPTAILDPCDGNQTARLTALMADCRGVSYLRLTRDSTPVIYGTDEDFPVGGSRVLRSSADDQVTIAAAGITVHEALSAASQLAGHGVRARVIDVYSVKPIDTATLREAARETGRMITVEDHWAEGGLGDAVLAALADGTAALPVARQLAVRHMPGSAGAHDQLADAGLDTRAIVAAALDLTS